MNSDEVQRAWATRSDEYSPEYYANYGADSTSERLRRLLDDHAGGDAEVLELGCGSGRHLAHLREHGFTRLSGVDVNPGSFEVMQEEYPELASTGSFHAGTIEDTATGFDDGAFDAVYTVETLQHLHPDSRWVYAEVARIAGELLVTVENEGEAGDDGVTANAGELRSGGRRRHAAPREQDAATPDRGVNYVEDDLPLYYRDWGEIFAGLGLRQVDVEVGVRDTVRVFREVPHQP